MRKKILTSMCLTALAGVILTSALIMGVMYYSSYQQIKKEVAVQAAYVAAAVETQSADYVNRVGARTDIGRITWISSDGDVLFDNKGDESKMENHKDRPEILQAFSLGAGQSVRMSDTKGEQTFYYALKLADGSVVRVSVASKSALASVLSCLPWVVFIILAVLSLCTAYASFQTKRIVSPINEIDPSAPNPDETYEELSPLISRIKRQNDEIKAHISHLRQAQQEFLTITEHMSEGLVVLDPSLRILSVNKGALSIFNGEEGCVGNHLFVLTRDIQVSACLADALTGVKSQREMRRGASAYELFASPVIAKGRVRGVILLALDITQRIQTERMRREFSANVSHELKTPLTSISGYAEMIENGMARKEDVARFAQNIHKEAGRLIALIEDIMHLSSLDEKGEEVEKRVFDLADIVKECVSRLWGKAQMRKVTLEENAPVSEIYGVPRIAEELVYNLLDNAITYNKEGGRVRVSLIKEENGAVLVVKDTGIGIAKEDLERIYERFYRVDKSHSKKTGGTGLGLSIVKHAALLHRASITTTSTLGEGTCIKVRFPPVLKQ